MAEFGSVQICSGEVRHGEITAFKLAGNDAGESKYATRFGCWIVKLAILKGAVLQFATTEIAVLELAINKDALADFIRLENHLLEATIGEGDAIHITLQF
jgi:hypothetical protein